MADGGAKAQMWKTARFFLFGMVAWAAVATIFEERGPAAKLGIASHVVSVTDSDKKFTDVMGVDEAKSELKEVVEYLKVSCCFSY